MAGSRERMARMIAFSASTTRKKIKPPRNSRGQTRNGIASVSNTRCNGAAYVYRSCVVELLQEAHERAALARDRQKVEAIFRPPCVMREPAQKRDRVDAGDRLACAGRSTTARAA
jgi:hypothetical protein